MLSVLGQAIHITLCILKSFLAKQREVVITLLCVCGGGEGGGGGGRGSWRSREVDQKATIAIRVAHVLVHDYCWDRLWYSI